MFIVLYLKESPPFCSTSWIYPFFSAFASSSCCSFEHPCPPQPKLSYVGRIVSSRGCSSSMQNSPDFLLLVGLVAHRSFPFPFRGLSGSLKMVSVTKAVSIKAAGHSPGMPLNPLSAEMNGTKKGAPAQTVNDQHFAKPGLDGGPAKPSHAEQWGALGQLCGIRISSSERLHVTTPAHL